MRHNLQFIQGFAISLALFLIFLDFVTGISLMARLNSFHGNKEPPNVQRLKDISNEEFVIQLSAPKPPVIMKIDEITTFVLRIVQMGNPSVFRSKTEELSLYLAHIPGITANTDSIKPQKKFHLLSGDGDYVRIHQITTLKINPMIKDYFIHYLPKESHGLLPQNSTRENTKNIDFVLVLERVTWGGWWRELVSIIDGFKLVSTSNPSPRQESFMIRQ